MYYRIYTNIRDSAWQCLVDHGIDRLPVDILKIARACDIRVIKNSDVNDLLPGEDAKSYYDNKRWIIIYNDANDTAASRFAIAHELGHIFLGHALTYAKYENVREFGKKPKAEQQADMFAMRLLCPACIIMKFNLNSPDEISRACRVPLPVAKIRSERMAALCKKNKFFTNSLEARVYDNFKEYPSHSTDCSNDSQDQKAPFVSAQA